MGFQRVAQRYGATLNFSDRTPNQTLIWVQLDEPTILQVVFSVDNPAAGQWQLIEGAGNGAVTSIIPAVVGRQSLSVAGSAIQLAWIQTVPGSSGQCQAVIGKL